MIHYPPGAVPYPPGAEERDSEPELAGSVAGPAAVSPLPIRDPLPAEHTTELGHARRVVAIAGSRLRYVTPWRRWLVWDGARWARDDTGAADRVAKDVARAVTRRAAKDLADAGGDDSTLKAALKAALRLESASAVRGILALAATEHGVAISPARLDSYPHLLNVANGVLDLNTGELLDHDPELLLTKVTTAAYYEDATAPEFEKFLQRIQPEEAMRLFLRRLLGHSLHGAQVEHVLPVGYGSGANGKSTLFAAAVAALGEYAGTTDPTLLVERGYDTHPTGVADLHGLRLAFTHETDERRPLAEGTVKRLTGGDRIKARRMREDFWEFTPSHTLFLLTNHRPTVRGTDDGIWRRLRLVPFDVSIPEEERDLDLPDKLADERDGILTWLVAGHRDWHQDGLAEPERVREATATYRHDEDALARFLGERTHQAPTSTISVQSSLLFREWSSWCAGEGVEPGTQTAFSRDLTDRGYTNRKSHGNTVWNGLGLRTRDDS